MPMSLPRPSESNAEFVVPEPGVYEVEFVDYDGPVDSTRFPGSMSILLKFEIVNDDEYEGVQLKQYYGWSMHKERSRLYPVIKALVGRDIEDDEDVDLDSLINKRVNATVSNDSRPDRQDPTKQFKFAKIESVAPLRRRASSSRSTTRPQREADPFDETQQEAWPEAS